MPKVNKAFVEKLEKSGYRDRIIEMRIQGRTLKEIVGFVKENVPEFADYTFGSLMAELSGFFNMIKETSNSLKKENTIKIFDDTIKDEVNELEELAKLYQLQKARVMLSHEKEKRLNETLHQTSLDVLYALKILDRSAQLKMDMGLLKRDLGKIEINNKMVGIMANLPSEYDKYKHVLLNPESRRRILSVLDKIMRLTSRETTSLPESRDDEIGETIELKRNTDDEKKGD
jgi:hypothetical protein